MSNDCPICYEELTAHNSLTICFNSHKICLNCYNRCIQTNNKNCGMCRLEMFTIEIKAPIKKRSPKCGICGETGHNRRTCVLPAQQYMEIRRLRRLVLENERNLGINNWKLSNQSQPQENPPMDEIVINPEHSQLPEPPPYMLPL